MLFSLTIGKLLDERNSFFFKKSVCVLCMLLHAYLHACGCMCTCTHLFLEVRSQLRCHSSDSIHLCFFCFVLILGKNSFFIGWLGSKSHKPTYLLSNAGNASVGHHAQGFYKSSGDQIKFSCLHGKHFSSHFPIPKL